MRQSRPGSVVRPQYAASFDCEAHARGEPAPALLRVALFEDDLNKTYSLGFGGSDVESAAPFGVAVPSSGVSPTEASKPLESKHKWEGRKEESRPEKSRRCWGCWVLGGKWRASRHVYGNKNTPQHPAGLPSTPPTHALLAGPGVLRGVPHGCWVVLARRPPLLLAQPGRGHMSVPERCQRSPFQWSRPLRLTPKARISSVACWRACIGTLHVRSNLSGGHCSCFRSRFEAQANWAACETKRAE